MTLPDGSTQHIEVAIDVGTECSSLFAPVDCALPPGTVTFGPAHFRQIKKNGSEQTGVPGKVELDFAIAVRGVGVGEGASVGISVVIEGIARAGDRQRGYRRALRKPAIPFKFSRKDRLLRAAQDCTMFDSAEGIGPELADARGPAAGQTPPGAPDRRAG